MGREKKKFNVVVHLVPPEEGGEVRKILFEEGVELVMRLTSLGANLYRLEQTPICVDVQAWRGDIIEAEEQVNAPLRFRRVVAPSSWRHWDRLLPRKVVEASAFEAFKKAVEMEGGVWEQFLGGLFLVHLPSESPFDPDNALERVKAQL